MQTNSTLRNHYLSRRQANIQNFDNMLMEGRGTLIHCCWECKMVQVLWKGICKITEGRNTDLTTSFQESRLQFILCKWQREMTYVPVIPWNVKIKDWKQPKDPVIENWLSTPWNGIQHYAGITKNGEELPNRIQNDL